MFTEEMQKAMKEDAQKLKDMGIPTEDPIFFSWNGDITIIDEP